MDACLIALPEELLSNIADFLCRRDLTALRLTSKAFLNSASRALFASVCVDTERYRSYTGYRSISKHLEFSKYVRCIEYVAHDDGEPATQMRSHSVLAREGRGAFSFAKRFCNVVSVTLRFNCVAGDFVSADWYENENPRFRRSIVRKLLMMLARPALSKVTELRLDKVQMSNNEEVMQSDMVLNLLSRLTALHLQFGSESYEFGHYGDEPYDYTAQIRQLWLEPASDNLTTLTLHQNYYFGYLPKLDLRGLHLPKLQTLALGGYVFSHDWQLDWLSSHSTTLENLHLDGCVIVYFGYFKCLVDEEYYPDAREQSLASCHFYNLTWSHIFTYVQENLHKLRNLSFRKVTRDHNVVDEVDETCGTRLSRNRYREFNEDLDNLQLYQTQYFVGEVKVWDLVDVKGDVQKSKDFRCNLETQLVDDMTALKLLRKKIGQTLLLP